MRDRLAEWRGISSHKTINHFITAIRGFLNWMTAEGRITVNPLAHVKTYNVRADRRRIRRSLTTDEVSRLLQAAEAGGQHHSMTGHQRALLYHLVIVSGLPSGLVQ